MRMRKLSELTIPMTIKTFELCIFYFFMINIFITSRISEISHSSIFVSVKSLGLVDIMSKS